MTNVGDVSLNFNLNSVGQTQSTNTSGTESTSANLFDDSDVSTEDNSLFSFSSTPTRNRSEELCDTGKSLIEEVLEALEEAREAYSQAQSSLKTKQTEYDKARDSVKSKKTAMDNAQKVVNSKQSILKKANANVSAKEKALKAAQTSG